MAVTTDMIWRASSLDGARQMALDTRFNERYYIQRLWDAPGAC